MSEPTNPLEYSQDLLRLATRLNRQGNIGLLLQIKYPLIDGEGSPARAEFYISLDDDPSVVFGFESVRQAWRFLSDMDSTDTKAAIKKSQRRQERVALKERLEEARAKLVSLDAEFSSEDGAAVEP